MARQLWVDKAGESYVVEIDDDGTLIAAAGPLHYSERDAALRGDFDDDADLRDDMISRPDDWKLGRSQTTINISLASDSPITEQGACDAIHALYPDADVEVTRANVDETTIRVIDSDGYPTHDADDAIRNALDSLYIAAVNR